MHPRFIGALCFVVGLILVGFGLNATNSVVDSVSEGVTGRYTDKTMWYLVGGGALLVVGVWMGIFSRGRRVAT